MRPTNTAPAHHRSSFGGWRATHQTPRPHPTPMVGGEPPTLQNLPCAAARRKTPHRHPHRRRVGGLPPTKHRRRVQHRWWVASHPPYKTHLAAPPIFVGWVACHPPNSASKPATPLTHSTPTPPHPSRAPGARPMFGGRHHPHESSAPRWANAACGSQSAPSHPDRRAPNSPRAYAPQP